jgi:lysophospholipase L1-like esterase
MDDQNIPAPAPSPISIDSLICTVNVPAWNIQSGVMELTERGEDDADYANAVDLTQQTIADGYGEEQVPSLEQIATSYLPRKKFYVEVHNPKLNTGDTITLTTRKYDGSQETQSYSLSQVDSLRFRTQQPLLFFDGPAFDPGTYQPESALRAKAAAPLAAQAPTIPGSTALEAQTVEVQSQKDSGPILKAAAHVIKTASLGDSMTMGCLGGNTRESGQLNSYPARLGQFLGYSVQVPAIDGNGIPAFVEPVVKDRESRVLVHNPLFWGKGKRSNPTIVPNNLAITGADVRSIAEDITMCEDPSILNKIVFWAGKGEDTRKAVVVTNNQEKAPTEWVGQIQPLPELVTIAAGANDALGVVIGNSGGVIYENAATECLMTDSSGAAHARNLSTAETFKNEYRTLISKILDQYVGKDTTPSLIFITIPDVVAIPCSTPLIQDSGTLSYAFIRSNFKATVKLGPNIDLDTYFKAATFDTSLLSECNNGKCGQLGLLPRMKEAMTWPGHFLFPKWTARSVLGTPGSPRILRDDEVLSPSEVQQVRARVKAFQKSIVELLFTAEADPRLVKLREQGKVHILDLNYLLYCLSPDRKLDPGQEPGNDSYSVKDIVNGGLSSPISDQDKASVFADVAACRRFYDEKAGATMLRTTGQGGVVGPDYIHPTPSGHAFIACALLAVMKDAAARNGAAGYAGYGAQTLAEQYEKAWATTLQLIQQDIWVPSNKKQHGQ